MTRLVIPSEMPIRIRTRRIPMETWKHLLGLLTVDSSPFWMIMNWKEGFPKENRQSRGYVTKRDPKLLFLSKESKYAHIYAEWATAFIETIATPTVCRIKGHQLTSTSISGKIRPKSCWKACVTRRWPKICRLGRSKYRNRPPGNSVGRIAVGMGRLIMRNYWWVHVLSDVQMSGSIRHIY